MNEKKPLNQSPRYRKFIEDRDRALEQIHRNSQVSLSRLLHAALQRILEIVTYRYLHIPESDLMTSQASRVFQVIDQQIDTVMQDTAQQMFRVLFQMRRSVYLLSHAGELEAIAQAEGRFHHGMVSKQKLDEISLSQTNQEESPLPRIYLSLSRIRRNVMDALEQSKVMDEKVDEMLVRVKRTFPDQSVYARPPKTLKSVREADSKQGKFLSSTILDDQEWDDMLDSYKDAEIDPTRFDNDPIYAYEGADQYRVYNWEVEKEMTHDFVSKVREGQVDAANQAGIKDFIWISILDNKTDPCCEWRSGLTSSEIEDELKGKHADDDSDALVPPAHFNCRCTLAPVGDLPDQIESNAGDFDEWLNS